MLNGGLRKKALASLEDAHEKYKSVSEVSQEKSMELYELRRECSEHLIHEVERYVNTLANSPKEFDKTYTEFLAEVTEFRDLVQELQEEYERTHYKKGIAAGVVAGAGVAAYGPTAALAIATTFGKASTGVAISKLSGAAASKAALAWLGGGAVAKGGAGVVGGKALLALAGPVGWGIGAATLVGGGLLARNKNKKIAQQAQEEEKELRVQISELEVVTHSIERTIALTTEHYRGTNNLLVDLADDAPHDYNDFNESHKDMLSALINHIRSLSELIKRNAD